jgi:hypothetical protein
MHTRNVNVKTAAQESSRKMGENRVTNVVLAHALAVVCDQNINIKIAAHESAGSWGDSPIVSGDLALELASILDSQIDDMISERMHIDRCSYEGADLYWRLQSWTAFPLLPERQEIFGAEMLSWIRKTACTLLERGYLPLEYRDF